MKWMTWTLLALAGLAGMSCRGRNGETPPPLSASKDSSPVLIVAAAANVQFAMDELELAFEEQTGIPTDVVISSSGKLTAQIQQGAPYDILVSADMKYPRTLYQNRLAAGEPRVYAYGRLVLWTMKAFPLPSDLAFLTAPGIRKIAIANPKNAPYGEEAVRALEHFGLYEQLKRKLVYGESIAQTNQYITSEAVDVGFTAKSVVLSPRMMNRGNWTEIPADAYRPIEQGVTITRHGNETHPAECLQFYTFLFSDRARQILAKYGYGLPEKE